MFVGVSTGDYQASNENFTVKRLLGLSTSILAARIAYCLDLTGPAIAIDTACSSSLVAVHQSCQSLLLDECETALAGGICILISPSLHIMTSQAGISTP